jgi:hypothetical protein
MQCSPASAYRNRVSTRTGPKSRTDTNPVGPIRAMRKPAMNAVAVAAWRQSWHQCWPEHEPWSTASVKTQPHAPMPGHESLRGHRPRQCHCARASQHSSNMDRPARGARRTRPPSPPSYGTAHMPFPTRADRSRKGTKPALNGSDPRLKLRHHPGSLLRWCTPS